MRSLPDRTSTRASTPSAPGNAYSYGQNFPYQSGSPISFEVRVTPVDAEGDLIHDDGVNTTGAGVIK